MIDLILIAIISILAIHYVYFLIKIYFGLNKLFDEKNDDILSEFVSIIIPFRNEEKNIGKTYESLINQNYPKEKFEIIFVDDSSEDKSLKLLNDLPKKENVFIYSVPNDFSVNAHKKRAIRFGIEKSKGEIIVTTDADCIHNENWLKNLLNFMDKETAFISGPVEFISGNNLFEKMQKLEFAGLVVTGAGLIGTGDPTICNAANIAYRKKVFKEVQGFSYHMSLSSGDDELLMQKIHRDTNYKIKFALSKKAIVLTEPNLSVKDFYNQRKRWASKGLFYGDKLLLLKLMLIFLFYSSLVIQPLLGIFLDQIFLIPFLTSFLLKIFFEFLVLKKGISLLFDEKILKPFLITQLLQVPYILISGFMGMFGNLKWKNRKIKR